MRILDVCSGTGCISLLLYSLLWRAFPKLSVVGLEVAQAAISLSNENLLRNVPLNRSEGQIQFSQGDIFVESTGALAAAHSYDVIISNPPYISQSGFNRETTRSVRNWEPKLALVPGSGLPEGDFAAEDVFYDRLLQLYSLHKPKVLVMEVGDEEQAGRVAELAMRVYGVRRGIEIWRDWPGQEAELGEAQEMDISGRKITCKGAGKVRAVVISRESDTDTD